MDKLYIPGDLVMTNGAPLGTEQNVVYRVTSSDPSKTLKLDDGTVMKGVVRLENLEGVEFGDKGYLFGDCCTWVKDIVPIPITPEILEKNGWKTFIEQHDFRYAFKINDLCYLVVMTGFLDGIRIFIRKGTIYRMLRTLKYVSDLQHLFFGLGINHEMEV